MPPTHDPQLLKGVLSLLLLRLLADRGTTGTRSSRACINSDYPISPTARSIPPSQGSNLSPESAPGWFRRVRVRPGSTTDPPKPVMRHSPMACPPGSRLRAWSPQCCHALTRPNQLNLQRKCEMSGTLIWTDRLRIERAVWTLNSYLQNLPWRSQVAKRRELRVNLRAASADVGTKEALRRLGNVRTIAADYIIGEYGGPTPSWWAATFVLLPGFWFMFWVSNPNRRLQGGRNRGQSARHWSVPLARCRLCLHRCDVHIRQREGHRGGRHVAAARLRMHLWAGDPCRTALACAPGMAPPVAIGSDGK